MHINYHFSIFITVSQGALPAKGAFAPGGSFMGVVHFLVGQILYKSL